MPPIPAAVQLRIALALVLLEHKPAHLSLHDYLARLREEVLERTGQKATLAPAGGSSRAEKAVPASESLVTGACSAEEEKRGMGGEEKETSLWSAFQQRAQAGKEATPLAQFSVNPAPSAFAPVTFSSLASFAPPSIATPLTSPFPPSFPLPLYAPLPSTLPVPASLLLNLLTTAHAQLLAARETGDKAAFQAAFSSLEVPLSWAIERVGELQWGEEGEESGGRGGRGREGKGGKKEAETSREEVEQALVDFLQSVLPAVLGDSLALGYFAALLIRFSSTLPSLAVAQLLPTLLDHLHDVLTAVVDAESLLEAASLAADSRTPLLSLIHLTFTSLPSTLSTLVSQALFSRADEELESRVLAVMEGCWALLETLGGGDDHEFHCHRCSSDLLRLSGCGCQNLPPPPPPDLSSFDFANPALFDLDALLSLPLRSACTSLPPNSLSAPPPLLDPTFSFDFSCWPSAAPSAAPPEPLLDIPVHGPPLSTLDSTLSFDASLPYDLSIPLSTYTLPSSLPSLSPEALASTSSSSSTPSSASPSSSLPTPPAPPAPTPRPALTPAAYLAEQAARRPPTGFSRSNRAPLPLDAPIQSRPLPAQSSSSAGSAAAETATSRKRVTAKGKAMMAKRARLSGEAAGDGTETGQQGGAGEEGKEEEEHIPAEVQSAMERKRLVNTLSARRCRARKLARVTELEEENERLREKVRELEAMVGLVVGGGAGGKP
ncbi:hypothetical protein JCM6882_006256 [Rhodosporidiobolus microsporus]